MDDKNFLGKGAKFPFQVNVATGRVQTSEGLQNVKESIYIILMTGKTERVMRKNFGSNILNYTFMDVNATTLTLMTHDLADTLTLNEPRISDVSINIDPDLDRGCLFINIDYTVREYNTRDNLVFPFYLNTETEEAADEEPENV